MNPPFRFLLVGTGGISNAYIQAAANIDGLEISGVVSRSGRLSNVCGSDKISLGW